VGREGKFEGKDVVQSTSLMIRNWSSRSWSSRKEESKLWNFREGC